jgi:hypothetical protein
MMKRGIWIVPLVIMIIAAVNTSVLSYNHSPESPEWTEVDQEVTRDPVGFSRFSAECEDVFTTITSTVSTYVNAVVTVIKAIVSVVKTVVVSVVKFAVRFAFTIVTALAQWIIAAVF